MARPYLNRQQEVTMQKTVASLLIVSMLAGCAIAPTANPAYSLIDPKGVDMNRYQQDYADCTALANQSDAVANAAAGAAVGAIFGALLGAAIGGRDGARYGAKVGAVSGGGQGAAAGMVEQRVTLRACLQGRGYSVIR
jgi:outer membrane lipoprotein SlyB